MIDPADAYYFSRDFPEVYDDEYEDDDEELEEDDEHL